MIFGNIILKATKNLIEELSFLVQIYHRSIVASDFIE